MPVKRAYTHAPLCASDDGLFFTLCSRSVFVFFSLLLPCPSQNPKRKKKKEKRKKKEYPRRRRTGIFPCSFYLSVEFTLRGKKKNEIIPPSANAPFVNAQMRLKKKNDGENKNKEKYCVCCDTPPQPSRALVSYLFVTDTNHLLFSNSRHDDHTPPHTHGRIFAIFG